MRSLGAPDEAAGGGTGAGVGAGVAMVTSCCCCCWSVSIDSAQLLVWLPRRVVSSGHSVEAEEWTDWEEAVDDLLTSSVPAGMVEADEFSCLVPSRLSDSVVVELQLMAWFGLVVSDESRACRCLAASSTVPVATGRQRELEDPV